MLATSRLIKMSLLRGCRQYGKKSANVQDNLTNNFRRSHPEVFLRKGVLKYATNLQENTHAEVPFQ